MSWPRVYMMTVAIGLVMYAGVADISWAALRSIAVPQLDSQMFEAIRSNDVGKLKALVRSGSNPNARDETGATALMHAGVYTSIEGMRELLRRGADVNAANTYGSTALMWAAADTDKVRLLLQNGAHSDARTLTGIPAPSNALLVATRAGNAEVVRLLLRRGAVHPEDIPALLLATYSLEEPSPILRELEGAGINTKDPEGLRAVSRNTAMTERGLLQRAVAAGVNPGDVTLTAGVTTMPALALVPMVADMTTMRTMLDRGADPNRRGSRGLTPLMMAAAANRPNPAFLKLLLERGADLHATDDQGATALDWALLQGNNRAAQFLRATGAWSTRPSFTPPIALDEPRLARDAVTQALPRLQNAGPAFHETRRCITCHHHSLPAVAVKLAATSGLPTDVRLATHTTAATLEIWTPLREELLLGRHWAIGGFVTTVGYALFGFSAEGVAPNKVTDAIALQLARLQAADGSWSVGDIRPPLFDPSPIHDTALAVRALADYAPPRLRNGLKARVGRARSYLESAVPADTQDESFKLLGLMWTASSRNNIARQAARLVALQREDGGWGQWPTMTSDAYATGQALYALRLTGLALRSPAYTKGVAYLLRTQHQDGSWFVRSRAVGFQQYFDAGFPHGRNQFISAAATSWAVIALSLGLDDAPAAHDSRRE